MSVPPSLLRRTHRVISHIPRAPAYLTAVCPTCYLFSQCAVYGDGSVHVATTESVRPFGMIGRALHTDASGDDAHRHTHPFPPLLRARHTFCQVDCGARYFLNWSRSQRQSYPAKRPRCVGPWEHGGARPTGRAAVARNAFCAGSARMMLWFEYSHIHAPSIGDQPGRAE